MTKKFQFLAAIFFIFLIFAVSSFAIVEKITLGDGKTCKNFVEANGSVGFHQMCTFDD